MPLIWTLSLVLSHSVASEGAPTEMNCSAPLMTPSFITLGPATLIQPTLTSLKPSALACFSTSLSRSISINGRKATPNCCATLISACSALVGAATATTRSPSKHRLTMDIDPPPETCPAPCQGPAGAFIPARSGRQLGGWRPGRDHRSALAEPREPRRGVRVHVAPPKRRETKVEVTERTAEGDRRQIDAFVEPGGPRFQSVEPAGDLVELGRGPLAPAQFLGTQRPLVTRKQRRVQDAVGQRVLGQHAPARRAVARNELAVTENVEILDDHPAVVEHRAVVGDERRHLSQRVLFDDRPVPVDDVRLGREEFDALAQTQLDRGNHDLADEW